MFLSAITKHPVARKWFILSAVLSVLFLIASIVYATGVLFRATLSVEHWLLLRPETKIDCVFVVWHNLGEIPASLILVCLLGGTCVLMGYRRRVLLVLLLLLLLGVGIEVVGKVAISAPLSPTLRSGMTDLTCPQLEGQPPLVNLEVGLGMLDKVAPPAPGRVSWSHSVAAMPVDLQTSGHESSYPSGHAARWSFIWFLVAWLAWRHMRPRPLGALVALVLFAFAFLGGFIQFYTGVHYISDILAGYLMGGALAAAGIGVLLLSDSRKRFAQMGGPAVERSAERVGL